MRSGDDISNRQKARLNRFSPVNGYYYKTGDQTDYKGSSAARFARYTTKPDHDWQDTGHDHV